MRPETAWLKPGDKGPSAINSPSTVVAKSESPAGIVNDGSTSKKLRGVTSLAEAAVQRVQVDHRTRMARIGDPYLRERLSDLDDLANRLIRHLMGLDNKEQVDFPENMVVVARNLGPAEVAAMARLQRRFEQEAVAKRLRVRGHASVADNPRQIRTFEDGPREDAEVGLGIEYTGEWLAARLSGQWVNDPDDNKDLRADGSYLAASLGNWMLAASTSDRYWGPGWQSSMILSNNARPVPAFTLEGINHLPGKQYRPLAPTIPSHWLTDGDSFWLRGGFPGSIGSISIVTSNSIRK